MSNINHNEKDMKSNERQIPVFAIPIDLLEYITQDQVYRNKNKFTRQQAFFDLVRRSKMIIDGNDSSAANYAQLCKLWNWSRPGLMAFIDKLDEYRLLNFEVNMRNKVVTLKPELFLSIEDSGYSLQISKTSCFSSQPSSEPSTHDSSGSKVERSTERKIDRNNKK